MPFEHSESAWTRFLRAITASRSPGVQVVGQPIEDNLRAVILAADLRNLTTPTRWAQGAARRISAAGGAGTVSRVELHCLSPGGLWVDIFLGTNSLTMEIIDGPLSVTDRVGITDFGNIPTVSQIGDAQPVQAVPPTSTPQWQSAVFQVQLPPFFFVPFGKVFLWQRPAQNSICQLDSIHWHEIPAADAA